MSRELGEFQHLLNDDGFLARRQIDLTDRRRYELLGGVVAQALSVFHQHGIAVGDLSPKNLLSAAADPAPRVYFIDCDAMRFQGRSVMPQLETPAGRSGSSTPTRNWAAPLPTATSSGSSPCGCSPVPRTPAIPPACRGRCRPPSGSSSPPPSPPPRAPTRTRRLGHPARHRRRYRIHPPDGGPTVHASPPQARNGSAAGGLGRDPLRLRPADRDRSQAQVSRPSSGDGPAYPVQGPNDHAHLRRHDRAGSRDYCRHQFAQELARTRKRGGRGFGGPRSGQPRRAAAEPAGGRSTGSLCFKHYSVRSRGEAHRHVDRE